MYEYKAKVLSVYDGDTITVNFDLGFNIHLVSKVRLTGIDTCELRTRNKKEKEIGYKTRDYLRSLILNKDVKIISKEYGKFGRPLVDVYWEGVHINQALIDKGYAKPYFGTKKEPWEFNNE